MSSCGWPDRATGKQMLDAAACRGDAHAFDRLAWHYQGMVYNVAYRILGDVEEAATATEQALRRARVTIKRSPHGSFKVCLLRLITRACHDRLRAARRQARRTPGCQQPVAAPAPYSLDPGEPLARDQLLQAGILTLPAEQRIVLVLSDVLRMTYQEIAQITGLSHGSVSAQLSRARAGLRDYLLGRN